MNSKTMSRHPSELSHLSCWRAPSPVLVKTWWLTLIVLLSGNFQNNCDQCAFSTGYCGPDGCNMQCSCDLSESNPLDLSQFSPFLGRFPILKLTNDSTDTFITNDQGIMVCNGGSGVIVGGAEG